MLENPFSIIEIRLNRLEHLVLEVREAVKLASNSPSSKLEEEPIKMPEVCRLLQISDTTARSWMAKGILPFHRKGSRVYFFKSEVLKALEQPLNSRKEGRRCR